MARHVHVYVSVVGQGRQYASKQVVKMVVSKVERKEEIVVR